MKVVAFYIDEDIHEAVKYVGRKNNLPASEVIRIAINDYLGRMNELPQQKDQSWRDKP